MIVRTCPWHCHSGLSGKSGTWTLNVTGSLLVSKNKSSGRRSASRDSIFDFLNTGSSSSSSIGGGSIIVGGSSDGGGIGGGMNRGLCWFIFWGGIIILGGIIGGLTIPILGGPGGGGIGGPPGLPMKGGGGRRAGAGGVGVGAGGGCADRIGWVGGSMVIVFSGLAIGLLSGFAGGLETGGGCGGRLGGIGDSFACGGSWVGWGTAGPIFSASSEGLKIKFLSIKYFCLKEKISLFFKKVFSVQMRYGSWRLTISIDIFTSTWHQMLLLVLNEELEQRNKNIPKKILNCIYQLLHEKNDLKLFINWAYT